MKKFGIAIAVLMCFVLSTCFAEGLDLESMTLDQLVDLRNEIQEAIDSRAHGESKQVYSGYYTAGSDIPVGSYQVTYECESEEEALYVTFISYASMDDYLAHHNDGERTYISYEMVTEERPGHVTLDEGMILYINLPGGDAFLTPDA